jgi:hypothetical protein
MGWTKHLELMGKRRGVYRILVRKPEGRDYLGDQGVDGRIILRRIFRKWGHELDGAGSGWEQKSGTCE